MFFIVTYLMIYNLILNEQNMIYFITDQLDLITILIVEYLRNVPV